MIISEGGFVSITNNNVIVLVGAFQMVAKSSTITKLLALKGALKLCMDKRLYHDNIYMGCMSIVNLVYEDPRLAWKYNEHVKQLKLILRRCPTTMINRKKILP